VGTGCGARGGQQSSSSSKDSGAFLSTFFGFFSDGFFVTSPPFLLVGALKTMRELRSAGASSASATDSL
jgi:F0F1-type ATP synthase assembly protein I